MAAKPLVVNVDFVITASNYDANIKKLRTILADHPDPEKVDGHPVLAKQRPKEPARWIHINVSTGDHKATILAVRDDNVYLIGFKAQSGTWFEFGYKERSARIIPGSTFLECGPDYRSLLGDRYKVDLLKLQLGKSVAEEAVVKLSSYVQPPAGGPDEETKRGLARLIVIICESSRMIPIFDIVSRGWASETSLGDRLKLAYLHNWGNMSEALLGWNKYGNKYVPTARVAEGLKEARITNKAEALAVVELLLNRPPPKPKAADNNNTEEEDKRRSTAWHLHAAANHYGHGRQLVEVFAARAVFPVTGTIAVFDGIHGQIIYQQLQPAVEGEEMVLTGPYRAISADGSFAIKVDMDSTSVGNDDAGSELIWNCYDDHGVNTIYDTPLKGAIATNRGPVEVTYAVLTNAVQAIVQVRLLLTEAAAAGALIHGKVTARSRAFDVASVLFSHGSDHKVAIAANESTMIPLNRSVISVPLDAPLDIEASFVVYTPADGDHGLVDTVQGNFEFYPELSGDHVKREFTEQGEIQVKVIWSSDF